MSLSTASLARLRGSVPRYLFARKKTKRKPSRVETYRTDRWHEDTVSLYGAHENVELPRRGAFVDVGGPQIVSGRISRWDEKGYIHGNVAHRVYLRSWLTSDLTRREIRADAIGAASPPETDWINPAVHFRVTSTQNILRKIIRVLSRRVKPFSVFSHSRCQRIRVSPRRRVYSRTLRFALIVTMDNSVTSDYSNGYYL